MAVRVEFAPNLQKHVSVPVLNVEAETVARALHAAFEEEPRVQSYVLDDQGAIRHHVVVFVNDQTIRDRERQSDAVSPGDRVYVFQALSGG